GAAALGGSWQLDYQTGPIEVGLPFATDGFLGLLDLGNQSNREGDTVALEVPFTTPAGPLHFAATNLPAGLTVSALNANTGQVTGTIAAGASAASPLTTSITATDVPPGQPGAYSRTQTFTWTVTPRITVAPVDNQEFHEDDVVSLDVTASS